MHLALVLAAFTHGAAPVDYLKDIKPVLAEKCFACHGALQQKAELRLDTVKFMLEGGNRGPSILPGKSADSPLYHHVTATLGAPRMPPPSEGEALSPVQIAKLKTWIDEGAKAPADEKPEADPRDHWAFQPPVRHAAKSKNANIVDAHLADGWRTNKVEPQAIAEPRVVLRRLYLDLVGLPPTLDEQEAFLKDTSPNAHEKVVDRLLASPQYGERWGRHWMDIWRYSDWWGLGADIRNSQKHIWHWRDWIVESLNADKGYDQMVKEMLAADELYPTEAEKLRATGFLVRHYFKFNRSTWLDETIEHTSKAFLGLTFNCMKCHDHKYDPFTQADYYRFRAFFEPYQVRMDQVAGVTDLDKDGLPRVYDAHLTAPTFLHIRGDDRNPDKNKSIVPALPKIFNWSKLEIQPVNLPLEAHNPGLHPRVIANFTQAAEKQLASAQASLEKVRSAPKASKESVQAAEKVVETAKTALAAVNARVAADRAKYAQPQAANFKELAMAAAKLEKQVNLAKAIEDLATVNAELAAADPAKKAPVEKKLVAAKANHDKAVKAAATPGESYTSLRGSVKTIESPTETDATRLAPFPTASTGRRSALALWIADARNPLTARVAVNHIWGRHLGRPLVASVFDFGRKGAPASHPELLDTLAVDFMNSGWSMKKLHKTIVMSEYYRRGSSSDSPSSKTDPDNRFLWRREPIRMEAQVVRDSLLHLAGELDLTVGGPSIPVAQDTKRRSLYFVHSNNDQQKFLSMFDDASVRECYRRSESIVPQQALTLSNSKQALSLTAKINENLNKRLGDADDSRFVEAAFQLILSNTPTIEEREACLEAMEEFRSLAPPTMNRRVRARGHLVHALLNHNDFITVR